MWNPEHNATLGELVVESARLLTQIGASIHDDRVADAPDARNLRYYQGLGLIDRPLRYDGRQAIYGRRHLVQVLAIKLLQSQGYALAQIQAAFQAQSYEALEAGVLEALGQPRTPVSTLPQRPCFQVAPGVLVTIDPSLVADPEGLARRIHTLLTGVSS